jgi:internalin A
MLTDNYNILEDNCTITINKGCTIDELCKLDDYIQKNSEFKLVIVCDLKDKGENNRIRNLKVLNYIRSARYVSILSNSSEQLQDISEISKLNNLLGFTLKGYYKKTISIKPLEKFKNLKHIEFENTLSRNQLNIIDSFSNIEYLSLRNIEISDFHVKDKLKKMIVNNEIKKENLLPEVFPNLETLVLQICKNISDFSFMNNLYLLKNVELNYIKQLNFFPKLPNLNLEKLALLSDVNLKDIHEIVNFANLKKFALTDANYISFEQIKTFSQIKGLKVFYARFRDESMNKLFNELSEKNSWINSFLQWEE